MRLPAKGFILFAVLCIGTVVVRESWQVRADSAYAAVWPLYHIIDRVDPRPQSLDQRQQNYRRL